MLAPGCLRCPVGRGSHPHSLFQSMCRWAAGYNLIGIPLAAGAALPFTGLALTPSLSGGQALCFRLCAGGAGLCARVVGLPALPSENRSAWKPAAMNGALAMPVDDWLQWRALWPHPPTCRRHDGLQ